jgi:hypothetical protein
MTKTIVIILGCAVISFKITRNYEKDYSEAKAIKAGINPRFP